MKDEKILENEVLTDEELEKVAGGGSIKLRATVIF